MSEACGNCRYYLSAADDEKVRQPAPDDLVPRGKRTGWCRRRAPGAMHGGSGTGWADYEWPAVSDMDWCGDYRALAALGEGGES